MDSAIILQHVPYETPGRIVTTLRDFGIPTDIRHLYQGDPVPKPTEEMRLLVIMGGPMNVTDTDQYPFLAQELELIKHAIAHDRPVLGICLGAQLIASAAGAKVYPNPVGEIGFSPVSFPFPGCTDPLVFGLPEASPMFHWHFQTFDLPKLPAPSPLPPGPPPPTGSVLLSSTKACKNQAFRFKTRLFGFQYHFEMTEQNIEMMLDAGKADVQQVLGADGISQIRQDTAKHYKRYERLGNRILTNLVQFLKAY